MQRFEFPGTGQPIRSVLIDGEPWFVGKDVAELLGYANPRDAIAKHVPARHRGVSRIATPFGDQEMTVISEAGVYRLVMRSNQIQAEAFQDWLAEEVIPSIRRTGGYGKVAAFDPTDLEHVAQLARIAADQKREIEAQAQAIAVLEPKAAQADHHRAADGLKAVGDFANDIKAWAKHTHNVTVTHKQVWDFLAHLKMLIRGNTVRHNHPTAHAIENGWLRTKETTFQRGDHEETSVSPRLTPKGEGYAWDRITRYIAENGHLRLERAA
ncbi:phage antirepressor [Nonomuraea sp. NPDC049400]|uniref:phage antirepressor n=1 Tax=Nonomuraea sp. NPDC049400 TaxID=3364352 RepID=UPI00379072CE